MSIESLHIPLQRHSHRVQWWEATQRWWNRSTQLVVIEPSTIKMKWDGNQGICKVWFQMHLQITNIPTKAPYSVPAAIVATASPPHIFGPMQSMCCFEEFHEDLPCGLNRICTRNIATTTQQRRNDNKKHRSLHCFCNQMCCLIRVALARVMLANDDGDGDNKPTCCVTHVIYENWWSQRWRCGLLHQKQSALQLISVVCVLCIALQELKAHCTNTVMMFMYLTQHKCYICSQISTCPWAAYVFQQGHDDQCNIWWSHHQHWCVVLLWLQSLLCLYLCLSLIYRHLQPIMKVEMLPSLPCTITATRIITITL